MADQSRGLLISYSQCATELEVYEHVAVTLSVEGLHVANPFTDIRVYGWFRRQGEVPRHVDGYCDCPEGKSYRIRFMPDAPGRYEYSVTLRGGNGTKYEHSGTFEAHEGGRRGPVRVDHDHPFHFMWQGTGEHYFYNGTTTYFLLGWRSEEIHQAIDRLAGLGVNRLRVALSGRVANAQTWCEHVYPSDRFSFLLQPWEARNPESVENPQFDVTRFNIAFWHRLEGLVKYAREKDVVISIVFYVDGSRPGTDPFGDSCVTEEDEARFYRYAVARLAAYPNLTWDIANEYRFFRCEDFPKRMGAKLREWDIYNHLISVHGFETFTYRTEPWADFAMYQSWDESGGYRYMLDNRAQQAATGRIIPQVNEEYGYEDHYPAGWGQGRVWPSRDADSRRRIAWEVSMAGCYQTTGERANTGTAWGPDTGGGWVNARGDASMVMLKGYSHMLDFFRSFEWWRSNPLPDAVLAYEGAGFEGVGYFTSGDQGRPVQRKGEALCLGDPGCTYALYLPGGGSAQVAVVPGTYAVRRYAPTSGEWLDLGEAEVADGVWKSPATEAPSDWAFLLVRHTGVE